MDYVEVANSIAETIGKVTKPLTDDQRTFLAAAIGPWLQRAQFEGAREALKPSPQGKEAKP